MPIKISTSPAVFRWKPASWLRVTGPDALTFMQGQFTNDVRILSKVPSVYGLWLSLKGKVLADSFIVRGAGENEFWIGSYYSPAALIRERLEAFIIADDVLIEDATAEWAAVSVLEVDPASIATGSGADAVCFAGRRQANQTIECVYREATGEPEWLKKLGAPVLEAEEVLRRRITARIPAVPQDVGPGDLPNEAGLDADAVSYTKGCYLGQEVMARLKAMGQIRRKLLHVAGVGASPATLPAPVFVGARQVGDVRSAVADGAGGWMGLAMVSLLHLKPGASLAFTAEGEPIIRWSDTP